MGEDYKKLQAHVREGPYGRRWVFLKGMTFQTGSDVKWERVKISGKKFRDAFPEL